MSTLFLDRLIKIASGLFLSCLLSACNQNTLETQVATTKSEKSQEAYRSPGKPSAPIFMDYKVLQEKPKVGDEIEVQVSFSSPIKNTLHSELISAEKLTWLSATKNWQSVHAKNTKAAEQSFKVMASQPGVYYVRFVASVMDNGKRLAKPFTIALTVGDKIPELDPIGDIVEDEQGDKLIIQAAESDNP